MLFVVGVEGLGGEDGNCGGGEAGLVFKTREAKLLCSSAISRSTSASDSSCPLSVVMLFMELFNRLLSITPPFGNQVPKFCVFNTTLGLCRLTQFSPQGPGRDLCPTLPEESSFPCSNALFPSRMIIFSTRKRSPQPVSAHGMPFVDPNVFALSL